MFFGDSIWITDNMVTEETTELIGQATKEVDYLNPGSHIVFKGSNWWAQSLLINIIMLKY